ncbi:MAG: CinA family protein [Candidatus Omnitrophota bacterium]
MEPVINKIHEFLLKNKKTIAVAESCTGGVLSGMLTKTPGSSGYFILGIVAYSNAAKEKILKIPHRLIAKKGAVSREVAEGLAHSIRKLSGADFGIGITGIAGPAGGSKEKPVGTVFIAVESKNRKICQQFNFTGTRSAIRKKSALKTLGLLKN